MLMKKKVNSLKNLLKNKNIEQDYKTKIQNNIDKLEKEYFTIVDDPIQSNIGLKVNPVMDLNKDIPLFQAIITKLAHENMFP